MRQKDTLVIAAVQFNSDETDVRSNLDAMERLISSAAGKGCDIIGFPEIRVTGYTWISLTTDPAKLLAVS